MRLIDADALMEILTTAIRNMKDMAKFLDAEDDPEIQQMEIKAYTDIANGIKGMPTIEERKTGKWVVDDIAENIFRCSICGADAPVDSTSGCEYKSRYCPNCGADMRDRGIHG